METVHGSAPNVHALVAVDPLRGCCIRPASEHQKRQPPVAVHCLFLCHNLRILYQIVERYLRIGANLIRTEFYPSKFCIDQIPPPPPPPPGVLDGTVPSPERRAGAWCEGLGGPQPSGSPLGAAERSELGPCTQIQLTRYKTLGSLKKPTEDLVLLSDFFDFEVHNF